MAGLRPRGAREAPEETGTEPTWEKSFPPARTRGLDGDLTPDVGGIELARLADAGSDGLASQREEEDCRRHQTDGRREGRKVPHGEKRIEKALLRAQLAGCRRHVGEGGGIDRWPRESEGTRTGTYLVRQHLDSGDDEEQSETTLRKLNQTCVDFF